MILDRTRCARSDQIDSISRLLVPATEMEELLLHMESCPACLAAAEAAELNDSYLQLLRLTPASLASVDDEAQQLLQRVGALHGAPTCADTLDREATHSSGVHQLPYRVSRPLPCLPGYEILQELGRGGMGVVYLARHVGLRRLVAIKMVLAGCHASPGQVERFRREAEAVARLCHPNIIQLYEIGDHEGRPYFALEYCAGGSLAQLIKGTPLPPTEAVRLVEALARGIDAAHQQRVIHRDLKPANILLQKESGVPYDTPEEAHAVRSFVPKITDFGLAKLIEDTEGGTLSGAILGTPSYMAPEQASGRGKAVGAVTDVYALGAILYETLTGRPPFRGATALETLDQVRTQEPVTPRQLQPRLPRDLETICLKCLRKEQGRRYQTAAELADDLRRFLAFEPVRARPLSLCARVWRWAKRRPTQAALLAVSTVALMALLGLALWFSARLGAADGATLAARLELERSDAVSKLADTKRQEAEKLAATHAFYNWLHRAHENSQVRTPGWTWNTLQELNKVLEDYPEGRALAKLQTELIGTLGSIDARPMRELAADFAAGALAFTPDGRFLALGQERETGSGPYRGCHVLLVETASGAVVRTLPLPPSRLWLLKTGKPDGVRSLAISPDGSWLVAGTRSGTMHRWNLRADDTRPNSWPGHNGTIACLRFDRTGAAVYSVAEKDTLKRWTTADWALTGSYPAPREAPDLAYDSNAEVVILPNTTDCRVLDAEFLIELRTIPRHHDCVCLAAMGQMLIGSTGRRVGCFDLFRDRPAGDERVPNKSLGIDGDIDHIALSPDDTLLAVASTGTRRVYLWDLLNGDVVSELHVGVGMLKLAFSPDGRVLAVTREIGTQLFEIRWPGVQTRHAACPYPLTDLTLSSQGNVMACRSDGDQDVASYFTWSVPGRINPEPTQPRSFIHRLGPCPAQAALNADGTLLASGSDASLLVDRLVTEQSVQGPFPQHLNNWGPDLLWTAGESVVRSWKTYPLALTGKWDNAIAVFTSGRGTITALQAGTKWTLAGARDGTLHLLAPPDARWLSSSPLVKDRLTSLALTGDDSVAAVGTQAGDILLLRLQETAGAPQTHILASAKHQDEVTGLAFLRPDLLVSASSDRSIRLWEISAAGLTERLRFPSSGAVRRLRATSDGRQLLCVVAGERGVRCWHLDRLAHEFALRKLPGSLREDPPRPAPIAAAYPPDTPDGAGLTLREFWTNDFRLHVATKVAPQVYLDCGDKSPSHLLPADEFSLRWRGWLQAPRPGKYLFELEMDDSARLWLDRKLLVDRWNDGTGVQRFTAEFAAEPRQIRVDFREFSGAAYCKLRWAAPAGDSPPHYEPVPPSAFFTSRAAALRGQRQGP